MFLGETGVGKELAARMIHTFSRRKSQPFVKINCANLNENLLESEIFGYKRGAFTGAFIDKPGLIEESNQGTLFLDEIADIGPYIQAKLLTVIEDREFRRLGENKLRKIDTRFIMATNQDISRLIEKKMFREDLYYRISTLTYFIPPLKERKEDIPLLAKYYLKELSLKHSRNLVITREALNKLMKYSLPGNVRELENILVRATVFSRNSVIDKENII